jgi:uncharacterized membrane-anchored protein
MSRRFALVLAAATLLVASSSTRGDDPKPRPSMDQLAVMDSALKWQTGTITLRNGVAKIALTDDFRFLGPEDAEKVLHDFWGNPPSPLTLGMIFPAQADPLERGTWGVVVTYEEGGYVKDNDAATIDYAKLLKQMQQAIDEHNPERQRLGYPTFELVGWAATPHYDPATHKLYWAKELSFNNGGDTLNYNIRVLGRRGVLVLNAVAAMTQFPVVDRAMPQVMAMVDFQPGNQYADFDPKIDTVAKYGLATLIAGGALGAAAKFGLLKGLWIAVLALKKFIVIGVVAIVAMFKKFFAKFSGKQSTPEHLLPPTPPPGV